MSVARLAATGLATWRVSHMLVNEAGPFGIFVAVRQLAGIEHDSAGTPNVVPDNNLLGCVWCLSVWVAPVMLKFPVLANLFAASALAIMIDGVVNDGHS